MSLDGDEPPRKIVRGPLTPEKKEEEVPLKKENIAADPMEKGGEGTVGDNSGSPSDVAPETLQPPPPAPTLVQPTLAKGNGSPEKAVNGVERVPRSVTGPPSPSMGTPSSLPPPPGRPSLGGGAVGALATRCPEMAKTIREIKAIQDQLVATVTSNQNLSSGESMLGVDAQTITTVIKAVVQKDPSLEDQIKPAFRSVLATRCPEMTKAVQDQLVSVIKPNQLRLSDLASGESILDKMEEREKLIGELDQIQKNKFDFKMKQIANSYRVDAQTIKTVVKLLVQKDPSLEDQIIPALLSVLEDLEKQI